MEGIYHGSYLMRFMLWIGHCGTGAEEEFKGKDRSRQQLGGCGSRAERRL